MIHKIKSIKTCGNTLIKFQYLWFVWFHEISNYFCLQRTNHMKICFWMIQILKTFHHKNAKNVINLIFRSVFPRKASTLIHKTLYILQLKDFNYKKKKNLILHSHQSLISQGLKLIKNLILFSSPLYISQKIRFVKLIKKNFLEKIYFLASL